MNRFEIINKTPVELGKLFKPDYWVNASFNLATPVVDSFSIHYWLYLACIALLTFVAFGFRFYKGYFLDEATIENLAKNNEVNNPIYSKISFFEGYFLISAYLLAFFFICRQWEVLILSNRLFVLFTWLFVFYGVFQVIKYFLTNKKLEESFFYSRSKLKH